MTEKLNPAVIDTETKKITVLVGSEEDLTSLTPTIRFSAGAYSTTLGRDFSSPVTITVTADDGTTSDWTVTVIKDVSTSIDDTEQSVINGAKIQQGMLSVDCSADVNVTVYSLNGVLVSKGISGSSILDVSDLSSGVYLVKVSALNFNESKVFKVMNY